MAKPKVISVSNQKGGVGKSTTVYNLGAGLALDGKKVLMLDVDPLGDLSKMLGQRKPHDLPLTLANVMNDVVSGTMPCAVPCIVRELTDDEAVILMVDSNLQRERVLPSEKAFAYKMKLDAMKRQGQRTDLTSPPLVEKLSGKAALSTAQIGKSAGESHEQVIKSEVLRREYRRATCQLQLCTGGFGASPNSRGSACFCTELYSGKTSRFERSDILGTIEPEKLPKWAKHYLGGIKQTQQSEKKAKDREGR